MAPQKDLKIAMGDIERKVDMSLDDIIKQSRDQGKKQHRSKVRNENRSSVVSRLQTPQVKQPQVQQKRELQKRREVIQGRGLQQRRDVVQRFVAMRSSALRQGKLAEARAKNNNFQFTATKAAARQAMSANARQAVSANAGTPLSRRSRQPLQGNVFPVGLAAQRQKILGLSQLSKTGATRRPAGWQTGAAGRGLIVQPRRQRQTWGLNNVSSSGPGKKPQTLDSRFASLREERQLQFQLGPYAGRRR
eukprot:c24567_g1_i1 orf=3231-3974(-)